MQEEEQIGVDIRAYVDGKCSVVLKVRWEDEDAPPPVVSTTEGPAQTYSNNSSEVDSDDGLADEGDLPRSVDDDGRPNSAEQEERFAKSEELQTVCPMVLERS